MNDRAEKWERLRRQVIEYRHCYYFVAPLLILVLAFVVYPILESLRMCFYEWRSIGHPIGYVVARRIFSILSGLLNIPHQWQFIHCNAIVRNVMRKATITAEDTSKLLKLSILINLINQKIIGRKERILISLITGLSRNAGMPT